jgi:hypothetical protein
MKQKIKVEVYREHFDSDCYEVRFSDLPKDIQDNDIIDIRRDPYDVHTKLVIIRERKETDEEYQKRISKDEYDKEEMRKHRYEHYLKLKEEFEK